MLKKHKKTTPKCTTLSNVKQYAQTNDPALQLKLKEYLLAKRQQADELAGEPGDSLESARARYRISEYFD
ncbi:MAG: hypothetical protein PHT62_14270 [Desulfotomaculaceae bacterium]|nr:hypothetical protein [Desulfotomaculaceae bacterium]